MWHFHRVLAGRTDETDSGAREVSPIIEIGGVDWRAKENGIVHHTDAYELAQDGKALIVRRGGEFIIGVNCKGSRQFDINRDQCKFVFEFGTIRMIHIFDSCVLLL